MVLSLAKIASIANVVSGAQEGQSLAGLSSTTGFFQNLSWTGDGLEILGKAGYGGHDEGHLALSYNMGSILH